MEDFDPQNMKHRLKAVMSIIGAPPPAPDGTDDVADDEDIVAALTGGAPAAAAEPAAPSARAPAADKKPFAIGALVFAKREAGEARFIMQVRDYWKASVVTRYVHPNRPVDRKNDQRHGANALVTIDSEGFSLTPQEDGTFLLKGPGRLKDGVSVELLDPLPIAS